jgi:hypothetical protein
MWAALFFYRPRIYRAGIPRTEVFNTFVENTVQNHQSVDVSGSLSDASTLCTEVSAGTFVAHLGK